MSLIKSSSIVCCGMTIYLINLPPPPQSSHPSSTLRTRRKLIRLIIQTVINTLHRPIIRTPPRTCRPLLLCHLPRSNRTRPVTQTPSLLHVHHFLRLPLHALHLIRPHKPRTRARLHTPPTLLKTTRCILGAARPERDLSLGAKPITGRDARVGVSAPAGAFATNQPGAGGQRGGEIAIQGLAG